jgi:hypothetical protein
MKKGEHANGPDEPAAIAGVVGGAWALLDSRSGGRPEGVVDVNTTVGRLRWITDAELG